MSKSKSSRAGAYRGGSGGKAKAANKSAAQELAEPLAVSLRHSRGRHLGWLAFCLPVGALLLVTFGTVGQWIGAVLVLVAAYHGYHLARTVMHPPGDIEIGTESVRLPRGLCRGAPIELGVDGLRHAYLLRRAIPWTTTGPVLIVEAGDHLLSYPRDWFGSESDQRRVALTINERLGRIED